MEVPHQFRPGKESPQLPLSRSAEGSQSTETGVISACVSTVPPTFSGTISNDCTPKGECCLVHRVPSGCLGDETRRAPTFHDDFIHRTHCTPAVTLTVHAARHPRKPAGYRSKTTRVDVQLTVTSVHSPLLSSLELHTQAGPPGS